MSLTNFQLEELAEKMNFPLEGCYFKDEVPDKLEYNKCYIVNLENELDENGEPNSGSHWTCFQINKYKSGVKEGIYFDPFGVIYSEKVGKILSNHLGGKCPYVKKSVCKASWLNVVVGIVRRFCTFSTVQNIGHRTFTRMYVFF